MTKNRLVFTICKTCKRSITKLAGEPSLCGDCLEAERKSQDGKPRHKRRCAICGTTAGYFVQDHDHDTGEIRGIICNNCNAGIGMFRDNIDFLEGAILYLQHYRRNPTGVAYNVKEHAIQRFHRNKKTHEG